MEVHGEDAVCQDKISCLTLIHNFLIKNSLKYIIEDPFTKPVGLVLH